MEETTKILIGTISGFIIAFFAEPVKIYFQNLAKKKNLRIALYKEVLQNAIGLKTYHEFYEFALSVSKGEMNDYGEYVRKQFMSTAEYIFRTECYKHALAQELTLFYQLKEATMLNALYADLAMLITASDESILNKKQLEVSFIDGFLNTLSNEIEAGTFDRKLFVKLSNKGMVEEIMNKKTIKKGNH